MDPIPQVRVLIVDDSRLFASAVRSFLEQWRRLVVVGEARNGTEALELIESERPDLVVMDLVMPGIDGLTATRELRRRGHRSKVLMVTMHEGADFAAQALAAGADAFVSKKDFHNSFGERFKVWFDPVVEAPTVDRA